VGRSLDDDGARAFGDRELIEPGFARSFQPPPDPGVVGIAGEDPHGRRREVDGKGSGR